MKRLVPILRLMATAVLGFLTGCSNRSTGVDLGADDPEMATAVAKARATLPDYWQLFEHPEHGESDFSLKVEVSDKHGTEHFWVVDPQRKDGKIFGTVDNDPELVKNVKAGDRIQVDEQAISDWGYVRDGKMHGKYTLRVLMKHMPAKEAEMYGQILADP
ncbi:MAG: DUF2314 domain-containing protein [Verrucomicrobia bacterium]|nr:MAG: DUF2314 domain-containing protein [Verrucomicrobiota bacterium]